MVEPDRSSATASLMFERTLDPGWAERPPFAAYHRAAMQWLTARLLRPRDPNERSTRIQALRDAIGELATLTVTRSVDLGASLGAAAGSYEPEADGLGPSRLRVHLEVEGSAGAAEVVVRVEFPVGEQGAPEVTLAAIELLPLTVKRSPTDGEREIIELSAAICAAPEDDAPRLRLAELWLARGEPRGAFVRAQIAGDAVTARALLERHGQGWTDGLPLAAAGRVYRRGFLCAARLTCTIAELRPVIDSPAWALLTALELELEDAQAERELLTRAPLTGLQRLTGVRGDTVETSELPPRVTEVHARGALLHCPAQLTALAVEVPRFSGLFTLSQQRQLSRLALLKVTGQADPRGDSVTVLYWFLMRRPRRVVLIGRRSASDGGAEVWRLEVEGEDRRFTGDERIGRRLRALLADVARDLEPP